MGGGSGVQEESGKELRKEVSEAQKALTSEEQEESPRTVSRQAELGRLPGNQSCRFEG